jgi:uroporphyrinogen-III synthase
MKSFDNLNGKRILVTRPQQQAHHLISLIAQYGGQAIAFPTLEITPLINSEITHEKLENLKTYQWLIFISANAVNFAVAANNGKIRNFAQAKIAAVGKATAKALQDAGLTVDLLPDAGFNSEALLAMPTLQNVTKQKILIVRGVGGRETLADELKKRGAIVNYWEVYQRAIPVMDNSMVVNLLNRQQLDILTITSSEALQNLLTLLEKQKDLLLNIPLVVISERIKHNAASYGFKKIVVSSSPDDMAILNTMIMLTNGEGQ